MPQRPLDKKELQKREAVGVIRASRFIRKYANSHKPIIIETILEIHKEIFKDAWKEIAGKYRDEVLEITDSKHLPPHFSKVAELMKKADLDFRDKLKKLEKVEGIIFAGDKPTEDIVDKIDEVVMCASWIHHTIPFIHPFREGNGRTARLAGNLVLERYGLIGISIKIEKENKNAYRQALAQIDIMGDYEPLKNIIYEGLIDRYNGVSLKYYKV